MIITKEFCISTIYFLKILNNKLTNNETLYTAQCSDTVAILNRAKKHENYFT